MLGKANLQLQTHIWDILAEPERHRLKLGVHHRHDVVLLLLLPVAVAHDVLSLLLALLLLLQAVNIDAAVLDSDLTKIQILIAETERLRSIQSLWQRCIACMTDIKRKKYTTKRSYSTQ